MISESKMTSMAPPMGEGEILAGKYRVEGVLGEGAHGVVVAAHHVELDERFAIKFLRKQSAGDAALVERFLREARAAVRLKNEHVVRVQDVGKLESGVPYIVMEFLDGKDLDAVLAERGRLPVVEGVGYLLEACEAIAEAHGIGLVHRDLKLSNLFLANRSDGSTVVKVLDFGIAKWKTQDPSAKRLTTDQIGMGSPLYVAPEQIADARSADARADIWSLGVILHEMLTGAPPFDAPTVEGVLAAVMTREPPRLTAVVPDAPPALEAALLACLKKDPTLRTATVAELARSLEPFASDEDRPRVARITRATTERNRRAAMTEIGPGPISSAHQSAALARADAAADVVGATEHATALSKEAADDDASVAGLPSPKTSGRLVAFAIVAVAAVVLGAVFVVRGRGSVAPATSVTSAGSTETASVPLASPADPPASPEPSTTTTTGAPSTAAVARGAAAAQPARPSASAAHAQAAPAQPASAAHPKPLPKPAGTTPSQPDDVRQLIDGRR